MSRHARFYKIKPACFGYIMTLRSTMFGNLNTLPSHKAVSRTVMAAVPAIFYHLSFFAGPCAMRGPAPGFCLSASRYHGCFFAVFTSAYPKAAFYFQPVATGKRQNGMQVAFLLTNSNPMKPTLFRSMIHLDFYNRIAKPAQYGMNFPHPLNEIPADEASAAQSLHIVFNQ